MFGKLKSNLEKNKCKKVKKKKKTTMFADVERKEVWPEDPSTDFYWEGPGYCLGPPG